MNGATPLTTSVGQLTLASPLLAAAGTVGYATEFAAQLTSTTIGAAVLKTITRHPRAGHPTPRLIETPSGMMNCVGLHNVGLDAFVQEQWPTAQQIGIPLIISIMGETLEEWDTMAGAIAGLDGVVALELNLSCPNVALRAEAVTETGHQLTAQDPEATRLVIERVRAAAPTLPLLAKLSPDVTDLVPIAQAAQVAGAAAVVIGNTFRGMVIDPATRQSAVSMPTGGVSGPAIRPLMVRRVWEVSQAVTVPIIGAGGVVHTRDALEYLIAGARAVEIGTAHFVDPAAIAKIMTGLTSYLEQHRMAQIGDLIGSFQPEVVAGGRT